MGLYSISAAIAEGTKNTHIQQDWIYDALLVDVIPPDGLDGTGCALAIPAESVELQHWCIV